MLTTPPHQNAITEQSITPLHPKTSSVPLDSRILKAATINAELFTKLEDASIHEQASLKDSYIIFWCQLSTLKNLLRIKAQGLETEQHMLLFLRSYWNPFLISDALHQPESKLAEAASSACDSSGSRTQAWRPQFNPPTQCQSRATCKQPTTTSSSTSKRCLLRWQPITRTIPNTSMQGTVKATVLSLPRYEESGIASWLNQIIASFLDPSSTSESRPKGWMDPTLQHHQQRMQRPIPCIPGPHSMPQNQ